MTDVTRIWLNSRNPSAAELRLKLSSSVWIQSRSLRLGLIGFVFLASAGTFYFHNALLIRGLCSFCCCGNWVCFAFIRLSSLVSRRSYCA